ncbi:e84c1094-68a5-49c8-bf2c-aa1d5b99cbe2 [Sclerotinia trifoliorum]|uniref:E84c1094-68a5-49c8-bf2c-aa1d5b99cbe2 n=1 Tax=Sclerotinia trifoliorum TaxID=28548 RepID=A0A8H2ZRZ4_9HELO|nr:e84c1094-68a5-49c8-bf2c-aa1d5b99cbe2 [Sclerotinia trifoliorum]
MASNQPAQCCTRGIKHEGTPAGSSIKIADTIDAYIAEPKEKVHKDTAILYLPDVIGIWQNSQLMADQFAANGYYTVIPDMFNGDPIPLNRPDSFDFMQWINKGSDGNNPHTYAYIDPVIEKSIEFLKSKGYTKIGAAGYCFGAKYVVRFLAEGKGVDVGYVAHPSFVEEQELSAIKGPLSIAAAETDEIFPPENRHKTEEILNEMGAKYQMNLYGGTSHGFALRGDMSKAVVKFAKEQAFLQAVAWFDEYLL